MNDLSMLPVMFGVGILLGAVYLSGLWLTVQRLTQARHPTLLLFCSSVLRLSLLMAAFYFILGDGHWQRLVAAIAGFIVLRMVVTYRVRRRNDLPKETTA